MVRTMIKHPRLTVIEKKGREGDRYDPYSYTELLVVTPSGNAILHKGLTNWVEVNGVLIEYWKGHPLSYDSFVKTCEFILETFAGYTLKQLTRIAGRIASRCRKCGKQDFDTVSGYPGEHFDVCACCGEINRASFNVDEVM